MLLLLQSVNCRRILDIVYVDQYKVYAANSVYVDKVVTHTVEVNNIMCVIVD